MQSLVAICHRCTPGNRTCPVDDRPLYVHAEAKECPRGYFENTPVELMVRRKPAKKSYACIHRGDQLRAVQCPKPSCAGKHVMLKVYACAIHSECSLSPDAGVKFCGKCPERRPPIQGE